MAVYRTNMTRQVSRELHGHKVAPYAAPMPATAEKSLRIRGEELRRHRRSHRVYDTMEKVAAASGNSLRTVQRAEKGEGTFETLESIAEVLGVAPWDYWVPLVPGRATPSRVEPLSEQERPPLWWSNQADTLHAKLDSLETQNQRIVMMLDRLATR